MTIKTKNQIKKAPQKPGVYVFKNKGLVLYIGKAVNLKKRISQYLNKKTQSPFLTRILDEAKNLEFKKTDSEIEALILESRLIKELKPKYNIMLRDDKQYFYTVFTKEEFPKIFLTHQPLKAAGARAVLPAEYIGPFTDGNALKTTLRLLRRVFPYCTCKQKHHNFCLNYHIGNCPGFCCLKQQTTNDIQLTTYKKNIRAIKNILNGKKNSVVKKLKQELSQLAEKQEFENAIKLRNQIEKLEKIFANAKIIQDTKYLIQDTKSESGIKTVLEKLTEIFRLPRPPKRIEGYDISNIQGKNATGAMAVFTDGQPDKNQYRKFKIIFKKTPDDTAMLKEVLTRRFKHKEWRYPDLIFIDGGIAQLNAAKSILNTRYETRDTPVISLAKGKNEAFSTTLKKPIPMKKLPPEIQNLIKIIDSEAHRFAISYYRKLHRKSALSETRF